MFLALSFSSLFLYNFLVRAICFAPAGRKQIAAKISKQRQLHALARAATPTGTILIGEVARAPPTTCGGAGRRKTPVNTL